jgi:hypothetical protein
VAATASSLMTLCVTGVAGLSQPCRSWPERRTDMLRALHRGNDARAISIHDPDL